MLSQKIATAPIVEGLPALMRRISQKELPHGADIIIGLHTRILRLHYARELAQIRPRLPDFTPPAPRCVISMLSPERTSRFARCSIPEDEPGIPAAISALPDRTSVGPTSVFGGISRNSFNQPAPTGFGSFFGKTMSSPSHPPTLWAPPPSLSLATNEAPQIPSSPSSPPAIQATVSGSESKGKKKKKK